MLKDFQISSVRMVPDREEQDHDQQDDPHDWCPPSVAPCSSEGANSTTNATDHVYVGEEDGTTLMTLSGSTTAGYTAKAKVYLPIS